jgi:plastocyanin
VAPAGPSRGRRRAAALLAVALAAAAGCGLAGPRPAAAAYQEAAVPEGAVLEGTVRLRAGLPRAAPLRVGRDREVCGETAPAPSPAVGPAGGLGSVVVLIEGVGRGKKAVGDLVIDHVRCAFVPRVAAVMAGARVRVRNSDPVLHNTRGILGGTTVFNVALPGRDQSIDISRRLTRPGVVRVVCDLHPHMSAWLIVHDSPYFAVTDAAGAWRIDGVPPGTWRVTLWHEGFRSRGVARDGRPRHDEPRTVTREVRLAPRETRILDFELRER